MSSERNQYKLSFEDVAEQAKETALRDGQHAPLVVFEGNRGLAMGQLQDMPDTHDERVELMRLFGEAAARHSGVGRLEQVFFVSEGWMSIATKGKPPGSRPALDPDRKEVLIISGLEMQGMRKSLRIFEMIRNKNNQVVDLEELLPTDERAGSVEVPLLDAFATGFQSIFRSQVN